MIDLLGASPRAAALLASALVLSAECVHAQEPPAAEAKAAEQHFDVHEYRVLGNTVLADVDIERALYPLLGDGKSLSNVEEARAALEKVYHDRGYQTVFVDIPEQDVGGAVVRLRVTEGRLNHVSISGAKYFSERKIMNALPAATAGSVPSIPALQAQLAAVNAQTADQSVVPVLKAGATPGTVDLALKVDDRLPLHGGIELSNQYSPGTKPLRATVFLNYANLFSQLDSISVQFQETPQQSGGVDVIAANYAFGQTLFGLHPSVYYIHSDSNVASLGSFGVLGKGEIAGLRFSYPIEVAGGSLAANFGADYKHFRDNVSLLDGNRLTTPVSYTNLTAGMTATWLTDAWQESFGGSVNFGPRGVPNNPEVFANKRFAGRPNYFYLRLDETFGIRLPWGFHLQLRADGQVAAEPLISNEEYAVAGADGVRGYLEAEALGDNAVKGSVQLESPALRLRSSPFLNGFVFYDAARAEMIDSLPGEPSHTTLRSYGVGIKLLPNRYYGGSLTWVEPLADGPQTHRHDSRLLFDVRASF